MKIIYIIFLTLLLTACSEAESESKPIENESFKTGDLIILNKTIYGGETIDDWNNAKEDAIKTGIFVTGGAIQALFEGYAVMVVGVEEEKGMVLVQLMEGTNEDTRWWTPEISLESAKSK